VADSRLIRSPPPRERWREATRRERRRDSREEAADFRRRLHRAFSIATMLMTWRGLCPPLATIASLLATVKTPDAVRRASGFANERGDHRGGWHGLHLAGGDFPAGAGTKYGVGYDSANADAIGPNRIDVSARAARSTMGYTRVSGSMAVPPIAGSLDVTVNAHDYEFPQEEYPTRAGSPIASACAT